MFACFVYVSIAIPACRSVNRRYYEPARAGPRIDIHWLGGSSLFEFTCAVFLYPVPCGAPSYYSMRVHFSCRSAALYPFILPILVLFLPDASGKSSQASAASIVTHDFQQVADAALVDVYNNVVPAVTVGGTTVTASSGVVAGGGAFLDCSFGGFRQGTAGSPANGNGFCLDGIIGAITFDFSQSVAAFGATFQLPASQRTFATITAYAGPGGTGEVRNTLQISPNVVPADLVDFAAIWDTDRDIRSVTIRGSAFIDEYALSLTPIPEPSTVLSVAGAFAAVLLVRATRKVRAR